MDDERWKKTAQNLSFESVWDAIASSPEEAQRMKLLSLRLMVELKNRDIAEEK